MGWGGGGREANTVSHPQGIRTFPDIGLSAPTREGSALCAVWGEGGGVKKAWELGVPDRGQAQVGRRRALANWPKGVDLDVRLTYQTSVPQKDTSCHS